jgi:hypothetical protein
MKISSTLTLALFAASLGCKQMNESSGAKSVDALVQGNAHDGRTTSECGPGAMLGPDAGIDKHLSKAWTAVPAHLTQWFAGNDAVSFFDKSNTCEAILRASFKNFPDLQDKVLTKLSPEACWTVNGGKAPKNTLVPATLLIQKQPAIVHRRLITTVVYAFAEYYVDSIILPAVNKTPESSKETVDESNMRRFALSFDKARTDLAKAFVREITHDQKRFANTIKAFGEVYGSDTSTWADNIVFRNYVLAEFTDAYYCNKDTRNEFEKQGLSETRHAFTPFVTTFGTPWYDRG